MNEQHDFAGPAFTEESRYQALLEECEHILATAFGADHVFDAPTLALIQARLQDERDFMNEELPIDPALPSIDENDIDVIDEAAARFAEFVQGLLHVPQASPPQSSHASSARGGDLEVAEENAEVAADKVDTRPLNSFPRVVLDTLSALSLNGKLDGVRVLGSGARRAVAFPSDVDAYAIFKAPAASVAGAAKWAAASFQRAVVQLLALPSTFLGDVKAGVLEDCRVLPARAYLKGGKTVVGYNYKQAQARVKQIHQQKFISDDEAAHALEVIHKAGAQPSPEAWFDLLEALRFEVLRWSLPEIKAGLKHVRGNRTVTLAQAWTMPNIVKLDCVVFNSATARYMDVSIIYELHTSTGAIVNNAKSASLPLQESIGMDVVRYSLKHKYMKVTKRMLSLATLHKLDAIESQLVAITNTSAGALYAVQADAGTCAFLVDNKEHYSSEKLDIELDAMKSRIASAQDLLTKYPQLEAECDEHIVAALKAPSHEKLLTHIEQLADHLAPAINSAALEMLKRHHLFPPPKWALP